MSDRLEGWKRAEAAMSQLPSEKARIEDIQTLRGVLEMLEASGRMVYITQYIPGEGHHIQSVCVVEVHQNTYHAQAEDGDWVRLIDAIQKIEYVRGGVIYKRSEQEVANLLYGQKDMSFGRPVNERK